jgi:hypothetical protein
VHDQGGRVTETLCKKKRKLKHLQLLKKAPKENILGKEQLANDSDCNAGKLVGCGRSMVEHCNVMNSSDSRVRDVPEAQ